MCITVCGKFGSNEGGVVGYVDRMRAKYTAKWGVQMAGMNFQTRSGTALLVTRLLLKTVKLRHTLIHRGAI